MLFCLFTQHQVKHPRSLTAVIVRKIHTLALLIAYGVPLVAAVGEPVLGTMNRIALVSIPHAPKPAIHVNLLVMVHGFAIEV